MKKVFHKYSDFTIIGQISEELSPSLEWGIRFSCFCSLLRLQIVQKSLSQEYILSKRQQQKEVYSAGGFVQTYWYSDACGADGYAWSWPGTPSVLNDFEITIGIEDIDYSIRLKTCDNGFKMTAYGWKKRDEREFWYQTGTRTPG